MLLLRGRHYTMTEKAIICYDSNKKRLNNLFNTNYGIDFEVKKKEDYSRNLLDEHFRFHARDLLDLYFYIEKEFNISISEKDILNGKFCNFNDILDIINKQLPTQE